MRGEITAAANVVFRKRELGSDGRLKLAVFENSKLQVLERCGVTEVGIGTRVGFDAQKRFFGPFLAPGVTACSGLWKALNRQAAEDAETNDAETKTEEGSSML